MPTILAVDLAAKYSAACLMRDDYTVISQFDSFAVSEDLFVSTLVSAFRWEPDGVPPDVMIVEDLPHGLNYTTGVKAVLRLQGRIVEAMHEAVGEWLDIVFAAPAAWRAHYPEAKRGTGPEIVFPISAAFGYTPPADLEIRTKGKGGPSRARKIASDYCSAYLIGRWAVDMHKQHHTYDVPGTSRYDTKEIKKKDFHAESSHDDQDS